MQYTASAHTFYKHITQLVLIIVTLTSVPATAKKSLKRKPAQAAFARTDALNDPQGLISSDFKVPQALQQRTAFWFDVYTLYGAQEHVIHHTLYPWIKYKVVDTRPIFASNLHKWTKHHKAERVVKSERREIVDALKRLSKMTSYKKLSPLERDLFNKLAAVPGRRQQVFREASAMVRTQLGQKDFFISGLETSSKYLPTFERIFEQSGVPIELTRIPFVESSFNVEAQSKVGASGVWQIMPLTAKGQLIVNDKIDERNSPLKASVVAANLFKMNYKILKQWPLAVTAYNHGAGGVRNALRASRTNDLPTLIDRYHEGSFKFASANFYTSFLAALHAEKYHKQIFKDIKYTREPELQYQLFSIVKPTRLKQVMQKTGLSKQEILALNLDLKYVGAEKMWLPRGYKIIVPARQSGVKIAPTSGAPLLREAVLIRTSRASS